MALCMYNGIKSPVNARTAYDQRYFNIRLKDEQTDFRMHTNEPILPNDGYLL
jgi:hypothetical protein